MGVAHNSHVRFCAGCGDMRRCTEPLTRNTLQFVANESQPSPRLNSARPDDPAFGYCSPLRFQLRLLCLLKVLRRHNMAQIDTNNSLLSFMSEATTNLQQALSKQGKAKKVNHRKYITKRLQNGTKGTRGTSNKSKTQQQQKAAAPAVQPSLSASSLPSWEPPAVADLPAFPSYDFYQSPPSNGYTATPYPSPPTTTATHQEFDPDLEELLTEIGLESPSHSSQYSCVSSPSSLTRGSAVCQAPSSSGHGYNNFVPSDILENLPSDFSDIDESYPSSRSVSPTYYSPSPLCTNHQLYGSYEWLPIPAVPTQPPVPASPSLHELLCYFPLHEHS